MKNRIVRTLGIGALTTCGLLAPSMAAAVERGFYVGGFYGQSESGYSKEPFDEISRGVYGEFPTFGMSSSIENEDSSYGFFGGYRLFRHLAIEAGYVDLGEAVYRESTTVAFPGDPEADPPELPADVPFSQKYTVRSRGLSISALGILPLSYRTELFARGGILYTNNKVSSTLSDDFVTVPLFDVSESNLSWVVGAGAGMTFAEVYTVRLEYQKVMDIGDKSWEETDVDVFAVGLTVAF